MTARTLEDAVVLGAVKTKPRLQAEAALRAGLDRPCARRRQACVAGTEEWLRRGRIKE